MKVSCIILCTFNDRFVKDRLIPSLLRNSDPASTEILVVDNGPEPGFEGFASESVRVIRSDPYHIPRAYNAGVAAARGRYVALFHDDCLVNDARWIEKAVSALDDQTHAVGPDLRTKRHYAYLKEVPLVMERENFLALGGYDESHYLGYQADLLCMAITDGGKRIARVEMDCVHFCIPRKGVGMSTLLFLSDADERRAVAGKCQALIAEEGCTIQPYWRSLYRSHSSSTVCDMHIAYHAHVYKWGFKV